MDQFEKVEKIAQKANVSFEEAKAALEANHWDMLDAMIALENKNKNSSGNSAAGSAKSFSTGFEDQPGYKKVDTEEAKTYRKNREDLGDKIRKLARKSHINHFVIKRKGNSLVDLPIWAAILIICCFWKLSIALFIIGLFCGCSYSFEGPDRMNGANKAMNGLEKTADEVKESFTSAYKEAKSDIEKSNEEAARKAAEAAQKFELQEQAKKKAAEEAARKAAEEETKRAAEEAKEKARKAEEEARAAMEEFAQSAAEFEKQDFSKIENTVNTSNNEVVNLDEIKNVFSDNSVTTEDGSITLEL